MCSACTSSRMSILGLWPYMSLVDGHAGVPSTIPNITNETDELVRSTKTSAGGNSLSSLSQEPHDAVDGEPGLSIQILTHNMSTEDIARADKTMHSTEIFAGEESPTLPTLAMNNAQVIITELHSSSARLATADDIASEVKIHIEMLTEPSAGEDSPTLLSWKPDGPDEEEPGFGMHPSYSSLSVHKNVYRAPDTGASIKPQLSRIIEVDEDESALAPMGTAPATFVYKEANDAKPVLVDPRAELIAHGVLGLGLINVPEVQRMLSAATLSVPPSASAPVESSSSTIAHDFFHKFSGAQGIGLGLTTHPSLRPGAMSTQDTSVADNTLQDIDVLAGGGSPTLRPWASDSSEITITEVHSFDSPRRVDYEDFVCEIKIEVEPSAESYTGGDPPTLLPWTSDSTRITITEAHSSYSPRLITEEDFVCKIKIEAEPSAELYAGRGSPTLLVRRSDGPDDDAPDLGVQLSRPSFYGFGHPSMSGAATSSQLSLIIEVDEDEDVSHESTPALAEVKRTIPDLMGDIPDTFTQEEVIEAEKIIEQLRAESTARGVPGLGLINVPELTLMLSVDTLTVPPSTLVPSESSFQTMPLDWMGPAPAPEPVMRLPRGMQVRMFFVDVGDWVKGMMMCSSTEET